VWLGRAVLARSCKWYVVCIDFLKVCFFIPFVLIQNSNVQRHKGTGQIYAMKVLNKRTVIERDDVKSIQTEKSILMKLSSPFLVKLYSSFQTKDKLYFVMDYINGGELFHHLQAERSFAPARARFYTAEIILGLEYLHKRGIIYRFVLSPLFISNRNLFLCKIGT